MIIGFDTTYICITRSFGIVGLPSSMTWRVRLFKQFEAAKSSCREKAALYVVSIFVDGG